MWIFCFFLFGARALWIDITLRRIPDSIALCFFVPGSGQHSATSVGAISGETGERWTGWKNSLPKARTSCRVLDWKCQHWFGLHGGYSRCTPICCYADRFDIYMMTARSTERYNGWGKVWRLYLSCRCCLLVAVEELLSLWMGKKTVNRLEEPANETRNLLGMSTWTGTISCSRKYRLSTDH